MGLKDKLKHAIAPVAAAATVVLTPGIRSEEICVSDQGRPHIETQRHEGMAVEAER